MTSMAAAKSAHYALLRARELCLLGDYDRGIPEFRAVRKTLETQLGEAPEAREVRPELGSSHPKIAH